jgi:tight adherence protein B
MIVVVFLCAVGVAVGVVGLAAACRSAVPSPAPGKRTNQPRLLALGVLGNGTLAASDSPRWGVRFGAPLVAALIVGTFTRWPVAGLLAAVGTASLPSALRSTTSRQATRRTEAVAVWTELLRDTLTTSAGLSQAIVATAAVAPEEIRVPVARLADRTMSGVPMDDALRLLGAEIGDPSADEVVGALRLAAASRAQRLVDLLSALADSTREEVAMRLRVEASRASARSGVRTVIFFSIGFVLLLTVVAQSYLSPFRTVTGQLVLLVVGICYAAGLALMVRLVRPTSWRQSSREMVRT